MVKKDEISDEELEKIIGEYSIEHTITEAENKLLLILKSLYEKYPTEKNNRQWDEYSNFIFYQRIRRSDVSENLKEPYLKILIEDLLK